MDAIGDMGVLRAAKAVLGREQRDDLDPLRVQQEVQQVIAAAVESRVVGDEREPLPLEALEALALQNVQAGQDHPLLARGQGFRAFLGGRPRSRGDQRENNERETNNYSTRGHGRSCLSGGVDGSLPGQTQGKGKANTRCPGHRALHDNGILIEQSANVIVTARKNCGARYLASQ